jgi:tetratricopeptide (TPR) repeat protein
MPNFIIIPEKQNGFTGKSLFLSSGNLLIQGEIPGYLYTSSLHYHFNTEYEVLPDIEHKLAELTFVITNRNKYFIGLKYDLSLDAPEIIMKGSCITAIKKYCAENNIPIINNKRLAAILFECDRCEYIPVEYLEKVAGIIAGRARSYNKRGDAYNLKGDYDRAIAELTRAIKLNPHFAEAYINRSCAYLLKGNYAQARADVDRALRINQNSHDAQLVNEELKKQGY